MFHFSCFKTLFWQKLNIRKTFEKWLKPKSFRLLLTNLCERTQIWNRRTVSMTDVIASKTQLNANKRLKALEKLQEWINKFIVDNELSNGQIKLRLKLRNESLNFRHFSFQTFFWEMSDFYSKKKKSLFEKNLSRMRIKSFFWNGSNDT